jgi:DNA-binding NtrC family response regulator
MGQFDILLAYDDPHMLKVIGWTLADKGCSVATVSSADEAIQSLGRRSFDAVLIDLSMDIASGFTVMRKAKEIDSGIMVILLACQEEVTDEDEPALMEADEYVLKPCGMPKLWKRVSSCLEKLELKRKLARAEEKIKQLSKESPP